MKLHLNLSLRRALLATFAAVAAFSTTDTAQGSILYSSVGMQTYTDFGQNCGRYQAGRVNDLLSSIRAAEDGVKIYYYGEKFEGYSYTLRHGMIDFSSSSYASVDAAIGYGFLATVQHNGVQNPSYAAAEVGSNAAVRYAGIEYRNGNVGLGGAADEVFLYCPKVDYKITRLSKLVTDVRTSDVYNDMDMLGQALTGQFLYRAGSGTMKMAEVDENGIANVGAATGLRGAYSYVTGGLVTIDGWAQRETQEGGDFNYSINHTVSSDIYGYITGEQPSGQVNPLPYVSQGGDSGSPSWVWNDKTGTYQYISALQSGGGTYSQDRGAWAWTLEKMESFNKRVDLGEESTLHFSAVNTLGKTITGNANGTELTVQQHLGTITCGGQTTQFAGVQSGVNTWNALNDIKDNLNWYNYGNEYLNANGNPSLEGTEENQGKISYGELMHTDSIILTATTDSPYTVQLDDTVDTGIGFVQFSKGEDVGSATFNLVSEANEQNQLNTAGFVVDAGVTLDISLTGDSKYLREWRKVGEGDLRISGSGNNDILLNVGGGSAGTNDGSNTGHASGRVLLEREGGYAVYNVLASTGSTIVLKDISQVKHDVTLGAGGATLDLNGNDYTWNNAGTEDGFTLHMLTEKDILANHGSSAATVTIKDAGDTLLGSFEDSASGAMKVIYAGEKNLAMHSTYTNLKNNAASSFTVQSGSVSLGGTLTVHGTGSLTGTNTNRVVNPNDWHYADAKMNVTVQNGATFTLDSHARLTGDVTVEQGGTFVMREGTKHQMEYIEGGFFAEDTQNSFYSQFHGLKGNITLDNGTLSVQYNQGTDSHNTYAGNITGTASAVTFDLGSEAALSLSGTNDFTVENGAAVQLVSGGVIAENAASAGYVNGAAAHTWNIGKKGYLAVKGMSGSELLSLVSTDSTGVLALTQSQTEAMAVHDGLFIGALEGTRVNYGAEGTSDELASVGGKWLLGGGGGELVVNFALNDKSAALVLGNEYTTGTVTLTNTTNQIGSIDFNGLVTLNYEEGALGGATINLNYGNRVLGSQGTLDQLPVAAMGTMLLDKMATEDINLASHASLHLGTADDTTYTGTVTPAGDTYRFGGSSGTLSLVRALTGDRHLSVDAQHYSGGAIELLAQATLTGDVTVMGYDSAKTPTTGGDITLRLSAENALASAASVTLKDGGILDVNGTDQQLNNLSSDAGSVLADSSLGQSGVVVVHSTDDTTVEGAIQVARLTKTGDATLSLSGNSQAALYEVQEGTLHINNAAAMAESVEVKAGATLAAGSFETGAAVRLHDGATLAVDNEATLTLKHAPLMDAADTATLKGNLRFNATEDIHLTGTLSSVSESNAALIFSSAGGTTRTREIDHLNIAADSTFTVSQESVDAAVDFRIHQLSGSGIFELKAGNYATTPGRYTLDGVNDFSGTVKLSSIQAHSGRPYNHYLVLENDKALQDAVVELNGWSGDSAHTILAVDTDNARVKGLTSGRNPAQTLVMAGTPEGVSLPTSNRAATLTITGDGTYTYSGNIVGGAAGTKDGLTLVMNGTRTQTLDGSSVVLQNATAQRGTLVLGTTVTVNDTYSIARDATLQLGTLQLGTLDLAEGKTLAVIDAADGSKSSVAKLSGELKLNGGSLSFSGSALSTDTAALQFNGLSKLNSDLTIGYTNTFSLQTGTKYKLEGMFSWNNLTITTNEQELRYLTAAYDTSGSGLYVTFAAKSGYGIWSGTEENHLWNGSQFGPSAALGETDVAVFTDTAASSAVSLGSAQNVAEMIIDSARTYTFSVTEDGSLTAGSLTQQGAGIALLGSGITVGGAAEVENGTLEMMAGSSVGSAAVSEGASLILHAADNTAGSISGEGALVLDMADASFDGSHIGSIGSIDVKSGTLDATAALETKSLSVQKGAALNTTADQTAAICLAGAGREGSDSAALSLGDGVTLSGTVSLADDAAIGVNSGTATLAGELNTGANTLIKTGEGTLAMTAAATLNAQRITVDGGQMLVHRNNSVTKDIGTLQINNGATYTVFAEEAPNAHGTSSLSTLVVGGSNATLKSTNHAGSFDIGTLSKAAGVTDAALTLENNSSVMQYSVFSLGHAGAETGDFAGTIKLQSTDVGTKRHAAIVVNNGDITRNAVINLASSVSGSASLALGLHDGTVTVAGLKSGSELGSRAYVFSGTAVANKSDVQKDDTVRTLVIATAAGTETAFYGSVEDNINIVKSGTGTQSFAGNSLDFNGTLTVQEGRLNVSDAGMLRMASDISVAASGTLELGGTLTFNTPVIRNEGHLVYDSSTQYQVDDLNTQTVITLVSGRGSTEGLSIANFYHNGKCLLGYVQGVKLITTDDAVMLSLAANPDSRTLVWNGTGESGVWDNGLTTDWTYEGAATESYARTDSVVFGAKGAKNVSIAAGTSVKAMTVQAGDYSFTGMAGLTIDGALRVEEGASATFDTLTGALQTITGGGVINADQLTGDAGSNYNFSGVRLNIGNGGMDGSRTLSFTNMTLGALDNWTADRTIDLAGNIVIDTAKVGSESGEGATITLSGLNTNGLTSLTKTGAGTLVLNSNNGNSGNILVKEGTLKLGSNRALGMNSPQERTIRVDEGGLLDINGTEGAAGYGYTVTLNGGTLTNSGSTVGSSKMQVVTDLVLAADSVIRAENNQDFGLIASGWGKTAIDLGEHTLEKTGAGTYYITNTAITGSGKLKVSEGTLQFDPKANGHLDSGIEMAGGTIGGTIKLGGNVTVDITADSTLAAALQTEGHTLTLQTEVAATQSGAVSGSGALVKTGAEKLTLTGSSAGFSGTLTVQEGTLALANNSAAGLLNKTSVNTVCNGATIEITNDSALTVSHGISAGESAVKGNIVKNGSAQLEFNSAAGLDINTLKVESGSLKLTGNNTTVKNIDRLELAASGTVVSQYSGEKPGANDYLNIGTLSLNGSATLKEENHAGYIRIGNLQMREGTENATLTLENNASSTIASLYELGTAGANNSNFRGDIILTSTKTGDRRSATLVLNNGDIAKDAVITLGATTSANAKLGLGLNAEHIAISGLKSELGDRAFVYGGTTATEVNSANTCFTGDNDPHTLTINTADKYYRYNGTIGKGISLVKQGTGTQELAGNSAAFNSSLDVQKGTLCLSGDAVNMMDRTSSAVSVAEGATLHLSNTATSDLSNKDWDGSRVLGYIEIGSGSADMTVNASTFTELNSKGTLVLNKKAQYDGGGTAAAPATLDNNLILRTDDSRIALHNVDVFNGNIAIEGTAVIASLQGSTNRTTTFNGSISGDTLAVGGGEWGAYQQFYMFSDKADATELAELHIGKSGNTNWTNVIVQGDKALAQNVSFDANCADNSGNSRGRLFVEADNSIRTLNSVAGAGYVAVTDAHSLSITKGIDFGGKIELGSTRNSNGDALQAAYATITGNNGGNILTDGELTLSAETAEDGTKEVSIIGGEGTGTRLEHALLDLAADTHLHLQDLVLAANSKLTDATAFAEMQNVHVETQVGVNAEFTPNRVLAADSTLSSPISTAEPQTITTAQDESVYSLTLNNVSNVQISGSKLVLDLSGVSYETLQNYAWVGVTLSDAGTFDTTDTEVYMASHWSTAAGYFMAGNDNTVFFRCEDVIPEPATATLSLLALAALAARRRRK